MTTGGHARPAVVLVSGGLDSATCLAIARAEGYACHALSFAYGQRHTAELEAAARVAKVLGAVEHRVIDVDLGAFGGSALTDPAIPVPESPVEGVPVTYVPARNTVFLSFALAWRTLVEYAGLGAWAILGATCYAHLRAIGPRHMKVVAGVLLALLGTGAAMQYVSRWDSRLQVGDRASLGELRPPALRARPLASAEDFFRSAEEVRARVDRARLEDPVPGGALAESE